MSMIGLLGYYVYVKGSMQQRQQWAMTKHTLPILMTGLVVLGQAIGETNTSEYH